MAEEKIPIDDTPIINTEKLEQLFSFYKFPLILALIGIVFLVVTISLFIKSQSASSEIVFSQTASPSSQVKIRIDIEGAVISPGVYELADGSRIADALISAGGLSADASRDWVAQNLNRAARLTDGSKVYIPTKDELSSDKSASSLPLSAAKMGDIAGSTSKTVNINTTSSSELEALAGVGPVTSGKIISGRPYQRIEELVERKIIGKALFDKLKDSLTIY